MKKLQPFLGAACAALLALTPVTASFADDGGSAAKEKESAINLGADLDQIDTLNPFTSIFDIAISVLNFEYQPLAGIDEKGDYGPILADKFETEGKVWTYHIRDKAKWSDGKDVTADDVVWTYDAVKKNKSLQVANGESVSNVVKVEAVSPKTVKIYTEAPTALHPGILPIVPKHVWEKLDNPAKFTNTKDVVGSGPFVLSEYDQGVSLTLSANPHYWGGKPGVEKIHWSGFKNTDAMVLALRNGEIDLVSGVSNAQFESLKKAKGIKTYRAESKHFWNLTINPGWQTTSGEKYGTNNPVLEDKAFRQAIGQVIDRQKLVDRVIGGLGTQGPAMVPPGTPGDFFTELPGVSKKQGVEPAKKALEAAGYTTNSEGQRLDKNGNPITLRLMYNGSSTSNTAVAEFLESWFGDLGIPLQMKATNWDEMSGSLIPTGDYDMYIDGWGMSQDPDYMLSINTCATLPDEPATRGASQVGMCDPEYDKLFKQQHEELDPAKRKELVTKAQQMIYEYGAVAMLYFDDSLGAYRSDRLDNLVAVKGSPNNWWSLSKATIKGQEAAGAGGANPILYVVIGVAVVAVIAGVVVAVRRRSTSDDRQ